MAATGAKSFPYQTSIAGVPQSWSQQQLLGGYAPSSNVAPSAKGYSPGSGMLGQYSPGSGMLGQYSPGSGMLGQYSPGSGMLGQYSPGSAFYGGGGGITQGAPARNYDPTYGGIPQVPSLTGTQGEAIGSNLANLSGLQNLAGGTNQFQQQQLLNQYIAALPGYSGLVGQGSANIASNLAGQVPQDVRNQLAIGAAERGISTGVNAPNSNAALLRALGLTSIGLQNQGQSQLTEAIHRSPVAQPFDISRFFFSPQEAFQAQQGANIYQAAPQPGLAGRAALNAAQSGLNAGRQSGAYTPASSDLVSGIAGRYGGLYGGGGTPVGGANSFGTSGNDWANFFASDQELGPGGAPDQPFDWSQFFASDQDLGGAPAGTITGAQSSSYDPYGYYYG